MVPPCFPPDSAFVFSASLCLCGSIRLLLHRHFSLGARLDPCQLVVGGDRILAVAADQLAVDDHGVDTAGLMAAITGQCPNVETNEGFYPILYLYRRETKDSGGPGEYRGGMGATSCWIPHDTDGRPIQLEKLQVQRSKAA